MNRRDFCRTTLTSAALVGALPALSRTSFAVEPGASVTVDIPAIKSSGEATVLPATVVKEFSASVRGRVITESDPEYEQARRIWNPMIDRRPALIVRCSGATDIQRSVTFARERELLLAVRGGGHSFPGYSMCNGGLVIDLSSLHSVRVDPTNRTAQVAGGAWIGDLDWESQQYGLATPMGRVSNTGVGGLTLGGGYGRLSRLRGLACDNLISADLITADAKLLHISATETPDLFWAIRGGGGNFGVVSSFEYRLHPVGPQVLSGELRYAPDRTRSVLEYYRDIAARAPRELDLGLMVRTDQTGARSAALYFSFCGSVSAGEQTLQALRTATKPSAANVRALDYVLVQKQSDGPTLSDYTEYMKNGYVEQLTPPLIEAILAERVTVELGLGGGAIADVAPTATALAHRGELFQLAVSEAWKDPAENKRKRAEIHAAWDRLIPFTSGFYTNLTYADQKAVDANWGPNRARLQRIKTRYDPTNIFRMNANIRPSV
jgi:FAD/FMN-containing dehydrogenase